MFEVLRKMCMDRAVGQVTRGAVLDWGGRNEYLVHSQSGVSLQAGQQHSLLETVTAF